ncbi:MAG: hypothetical protein ABJA74_04975 [Lapillicoccus sp.]
MSTTTPTPEWQRWVEAAKILADDPRARVLCPRNEDEYLEVTDVPLEGDTEQVERHLRCPGCGASNSILKPAGR